MANYNEPKVATPEIEIPSDLPHVFKEHYKLGDVLGEGGYSIVKLGTHKYTNKKVAVKIVTRANLTKSDDVALRQEVDILKDLKHKNIVQCFDFFEEEKFYYVILEYMAGGELFDRIVLKSFYNEKEARDVVKIILQAIAFCHDKRIVHRSPSSRVADDDDDDDDDDGDDDDDDDMIMVMMMVVVVMLMMMMVMMMMMIK